MEPADINDVKVVQEHVNVAQNAGVGHHRESYHDKPETERHELKDAKDRAHLLDSHAQVE